MTSESLEELLIELATLRAKLSARDARIAELEAALEKAEQEAADRWAAIGKLAPAAKRLRIERDQLRAKLDGDGDEPT